MGGEFYSWCRELGQGPLWYDALGFCELKDLSNTPHSCSPILASMSTGYSAGLSAFRLTILNHVFGRDFGAVKSDLWFNTRISSRTSLLTLLQQ